MHNKKKNIGDVKKSMTDVVEGTGEPTGNVALQLVKVSNSFARGQWRLNGVMAPKIIMQVALQVEKGDSEFRNYLVPFKVISDSPRLGLKTREELEVVADGLLSHEVRLEKENGGYAKYRLFAKFEVDFVNQAIEVSFHPDLKGGFMALGDNFTLLSFVDFVKLPTTYSQKLYRLLSSWKNIKSKTKVISLEDIHYTLETPPSLQDNFHDFRRRVLDRSVKEINENTHLKFDWEAKAGNGRKIVAIEFIFDQSHINSPEKNKLITVIINEFGVSEREAQLHSANKTEEVLEAFIKYMRSLLKKKSNISDIASYARTTLVNFVPSSKQAKETPRSFYESLPEGKKAAWQKQYIAAQNIPENLEPIVIQGLNESNEDFLSFITQAREQSSSKTKEKQRERKTNEGWNKAKAILKEKLSSGYDTWIEPVDFWDEDDTTFQLIADDGDRYFAKYLETNYLADIEAALLEVGITKEVIFHF